MFILTQVPNGGVYSVINKDKKKTVQCFEEEDDAVRYIQQLEASSYEKKKKQIKARNRLKKREAAVDKLDKDPQKRDSIISQAEKTVTGKLNGERVSERRGRRLFGARAVHGWHL